MIILMVVGNQRIGIDITKIAETAITLHTEQTKENMMLKMGCLDDDIMEEFYVTLENNIKEKAEELKGNVSKERLKVFIESCKKQLKKEVLNSN